MITLYGMGSPNVVKIILMLEEAGLSYELLRCDVILGEQHHAEFLALNPNAKVPVLVDTEGPGGVTATVAESGAILIYLAEKTGLFLPERAPERYRVLQWLMFQMGGIGPSFGQAIHFTAAAPDQPYARARFVTEMNRLLDVTDRELSISPYLAGDAYSIADMSVFPWLRPLDRFFPDMAERPHLRRWREMLNGRPAVVRTHEILAELALQDAASFQLATPEILDRYFGRSHAA